MRLRITTIEDATARAMADPNTPTLKEIQDNFEYYQKRLDDIFGPLARPPYPAYQSTTGRKLITDAPPVFTANYAKDVEKTQNHLFDWTFEPGYHDAYFLG